ncbi:MAG: LamG domain-containing protein [Spirochaetota bacterium]
MGSLDLEGSATYVDDRDGAEQSAVSFDGKDERLSLAMDKFAEHPINNLGEDGISFSFWMEDFGGNDRSSIVARWPAFGGEYAYDLQFSSDGGLRVWGDSSAVSDYVPSSYFGDGWNHVAVTWSFSADRLVIYVNALERASSDAAPFDNLSVRQAPIIGLANNELRRLDEFFGAVDDFRIYDTVISAAEVLMLYHE